MRINFREVPMLIAVLLSVVGVTASFYISFLAPDEIATKTVTRGEWAQVQEDLKRTNEALGNLSANLEKVGNPEAVSLLVKIEALESSYQELSGLFLSEQQRAITLPLLKGEVAQQEEKIAFLSEEFGALNSSVQWLIALMLTSFAALIGVIVTILMQGKSANK